MQAVYTASLGDESAASVSASTGADSSSLSLIELSLSVSPQSLTHAQLFFDKAARLLSTRGLLVHPDPRQQTLIVLLPSALHNEKGVKSVLSWLLPLLPAAPPALKKQSKAAPDWSCLLRAVDHAGDGAALGERIGLQIGQPDHWTVEMQLLKGKQTSSGAADAVVQACILHAVRLELNRQGWSLVGGRFVRIPAGVTPSPSVPAVQLTLTLTQQRQLNMHIHVTHVRFNAIHVKASAAASDLNFAETVVKVIPDLTESQIVQVAGMAELGKSLGVDREMWLERHGIALPPSFPVVQVIMGINDAFGPCPVSTYPLCCCLSSGLTEVNPRSRDEPAKQRLQQERTAALQEMLAILKGVRVMAPSTGAIGPLLQSFEQHDADPLLQLLSGKAAATDTISSDVGFQKASSLTSTATADSSAAGSRKRKPLIALTIPRSKKVRVAEGSTGDGGASGDNSGGLTLSLAFVKSTTQLPTPSITAASSFGSSWGSAAAPKASASRGASASEASRMLIHKGKASAGEKPKKPTTPVKTSATAAKTPLAAPAVAGQGGASAATAKKTAAAVPSATKNKSTAKEPSKPAATPKKKSAKEIEAERAACAEKEKAARAAAKAAAKAEAKAAKVAAAAESGKGGKGGKDSKLKGKSAAAASTGWGADFAAAFAAELSKPADAEAEKAAAEFRKAMGHD